MPLEHFSLCVDFYRRCRFTRESGLSDLVWLPRVDIAEREGLRMALGMYGIDPHVPTCPQIPIVGTSRILDDAAYVTNSVGGWRSDVSAVSVGEFWFPVCGSGVADR